MVVSAGDRTISEIGDSGYTIGTWSCTNGTAGTPGSASATVNLALAEEVTCTITNTLIADPSIDIVKSATDGLDFQIVNVGDFDSFWVVTGYHGCVPVR